MDLRHVRAFVALADEAHFTRAAVQMGVSQQHLSRLVAELETLLGVRLVDRTTRTLHLTPAGRAFLEEVRPILTQAERAVTVARQTHLGHRGRLEIGYTGPAWWTLLPEALRRHRAQHPDVDLVPSEMYTPQQVDALQNARLHVGFLHPPVDAPDLRVELLFEEPLEVVLPEHHVLGQAQSVSLPALARENFILFPRTVGPVLYDAVQAACYAAGFAPRVVQEMLPQQARAELVASGLGITFASQSVSRLGLRGVVFRPLEGVTLTMPLALAWSRTAETALVRAFLDTVRKLNALK